MSDMSEVRVRLIQPQPKPNVRPSRKNALMLWCIAMLGLIASSLLLGFCLPESLLADSFVLQLISDLVYYLPFLVLPVVLLAKRKPGLSEAYRLNSRFLSPFMAILIAVLAVLGVFFVNDITLLWSIPFEQLGLNPLTGGIETAHNTRELLLSCLAVAVIPAICEEFLFRGVILSALERYGTKRAIWISALLFMLLHASFVGAPSELILGAIIAWLVFWCDSIYAGLIYHTVHNATIVALCFLQGDAAETASELSTLESIGGLAGVVSVLIGTAITALMIRSILRTIRLRGQLRGIVMEKRQKERMTRGEKAFLALGIAGCVLLYAADVISMLGG